MFGLNFEATTTTLNNVMGKVSERGMQYKPTTIEFDCNPIPEFNCCHSVMLETDMSILDEGMDLLSPEEFLEMFEFPVMQDEEFLGFQDFLLDYHR